MMCQSRNRWEESPELLSLPPTTSSREQHITADINQCKESALSHYVKSIENRCQKGCCIYISLAIQCCTWAPTTKWSKRSLEKDISISGPRKQACNSRTICSAELLREARVDELRLQLPYEPIKRLYTRI